MSTHEATTIFKTRHLLSMDASGFRVCFSFFQHDPLTQDLRTVKFKIIICLRLAWRPSEIRAALFDYLFIEFVYSLCKPRCKKRYVGST